MQTSIYWHYAVYATAGQHDRHPPSRARKQAGHACRLWASVLIPFCSLPTLTRLWHWPACGEALSPPRLTAAASWLHTHQKSRENLPTAPLQPPGWQLCYRCKRGKESQRWRERAEGGGSQFHSAPPLWPHQPGQEKSQLLSHHPGGLLLHATSPRSLLNVPEERYSGDLMLPHYRLAWCRFPPPLHWSAHWALAAVVFERGRCFMWVIYLTRGISLFQPSVPV